MPIPNEVRIAHDRVNLAISLTSVQASQLASICDFVAHATTSEGFIYDLSVMLRRNNPVRTQWALHSRDMGAPGELGERVGYTMLLRQEEE